MLHALVISLAVLALRAAAQAPLPPLPRLELNSYPASTRDAVSPALGAATARPMDSVAVGALGRVLHAWEQFDAADQAYARAQALAPLAFEWHYLDGVVLERTARHAAAAAQFEQALAASPRYTAAQVALAEALLGAGDLDRSRAAFEALGADPPAAARAQFGLGRIEAARNRHDAAIAHFERAVAMVPEWGAPYYALAQSYRAAGRLDDARRALERHAQYGARGPGMDDPVLLAVNALRDDARTNLQRGLELDAAGDLAGAIAAHEAALARDPDYAQAHANLISLYGRARNWASAEEHYRATVALGFSLADAHYDYGVLLALQAKWDGAEEAYRLAVAVNPLHVEAHNNLGQLLERRGRLDAAAAEYGLAVDARPAFRLARFNLGRMLLALDRAPNAITVLEPLLAWRDADTPRELFALATAHLRAGHRDEGVRWAASARQLALELGQRDLAAVIERQLAALK